MHNSMGIIEPYKDGFVEIIPEGDRSDYWQIAAIHINGEVFCPSPRIYPSTNVALARARKIFNWICDREAETGDGQYYCEELNIILWRLSKDL
ncbi:MULTISPECIES: hypothetical protein [Nostocales]|uniref:Uncharacterized protein n=3 Tax=Nostocales TaxID=1161 RepID=A0A0C1QWZ8_9CYAN|nr:hypothetical protein [Tolypothrix bouteillei]KAF3885789.1 hypothetical protein DA73_0400010155 [Tolypothrix bouteillei VB521301]